MQICKCSVRIRDSNNHIVANKQVTVPEIRVLQHIHGGKTAVDNIVPVEFKRDFDHDSERQRLRSIYERGNGNGDEAHGLIGRLFGAHGRLPTTLKEIGYDPRQIADQMRARANEMRAAADALTSVPSEDLPLSEDEEEAIRLMEAREADDDDDGDDTSEAPVDAARRSPAPSRRPRFEVGADDLA